MTSTAPCPSPARLKQLLAEDLCDLEQSGLTAYVERCEACQHTLEELTGCGPTWAQALEHLAQAAPELAPEADPRPSAPYVSGGLLPVTLWRPRTSRRLWCSA